MWFLQKNGTMKNRVPKWDRKMEPDGGEWGGVKKKTQPTAGAFTFEL